MLDGRPVITGATPTLGIDGGRYGARDGCYGGGGGSGDGPLVAKPDGPISFDFTSYYQTLVLCVNPEEVMNRVDRYQSALKNARRYQVEGGRNSMTLLAFLPRPG